MVGREGTEQSVIAFAIDVTEKLRAEEERERLEAHLRQAQKMQSLGTLAGGIAHDFNNILLAISGNTRLAAEDLPSDHPAQISLSEIVKASSRASSIVSQILAFSRREEPSRVLVDLRAILEESVNLMRAALPLRVSIATRIVSAAPVIQGDPAQIHQVLLNLATNAAHAMADAGGGTLHIDLEDVSVEADHLEHAASLPAGPYHRISVRDNGSGMDADLIDRIFEPFFTTKPRGQGTGLGLSVVHGIVKAHGGAISVQSAPGQGSTFHVFLPAAKGRVVPEPASSAPPRGAGQSILYVDDEEPLVYLVTRVLERLGYRVTGYSDACAALDHFLGNADRYAAIVTDLSMPGLSGADLARQVLQVRPDLPVIMTSGYVSAADRDAAMRTGVRELLLKPNTVEELGQVLHRLLAGGTAPA
jgi:signal transduction histidine kinase/CheY-like chemotaxis protein